MMEILKLEDGLYWTGIVDKDLKVFDIVMYTEFGTTYNSYILKTKDHVILFETAKAKFFDEYLAKIQEVADIKDIDYIVVSHTEPDHSGSIERLLELNPDITILATQVAINFLKEIVNNDFKYQAIKDNEELVLDDEVLKFFFVPNLHWPDTMYTYITTKKALVTCDSFGSHYAFDDVLLSKVTAYDDYMKASKYYFDNILGPFKSFMNKALDKISTLDIKYILTGHGPVIDTKIKELYDTYRMWCKEESHDDKLVVVPYVSAYGYTEELAKAIKAGIEEVGVKVEMYDMVTSDKDHVLERISIADGLLLGSPTILNDALRPIYELTLYMYPQTHGCKMASAFGSYGWSGEAVPNLLTRLKQLRMSITDNGFKVKFKPTKNDLEDARAFGREFADKLLGQKECNI